MSSLTSSVAISESTYKKIKGLYPFVDSYNVVKEVDKYRNYWRPPNTKVVLLAESHVFTSDEEFKAKVDYSSYRDMIPNYPDGYVKFVYCFGYAEHSLLRKVPASIKLRSGTPQFWKLFTVCASENGEFDFDSIKKTTTETDERIRNKIGLLNRLREKGTWLVDSSVVGLYRGKDKKPRSKIMEEIIRISWDNYVKGLVTSGRPRYIMCIGKFVYDTLNARIAETKIPFDFIHQPQFRLTSAEREKQYRKLQSICSKYCS
jgi:hypothetical protein